MGTAPPFQGEDVSRDTPNGEEDTPIQRRQSSSRRPSTMTRDRTSSISLNIDTLSLLDPKLQRLEVRKSMKG